jgi:hypothetical protein
MQWFARVVQATTLARDGFTTCWCSLWLLYGVWTVVVVRPWPLPFAPLNACCFLVATRPTPTHQPLTGLVAVICGFVSVCCHF